MKRRRGGSRSTMVGGDEQGAMEVKKRREQAASGQASRKEGKEESSSLSSLSIVLSLSLSLSLSPSIPVTDSIACLRAFHLAQCHLSPSVNWRNGRIWTRQGSPRVYSITPPWCLCMDRKREHAQSMAPTLLLCHHCWTREALLRSEQKVKITSVCQRAQ